MHMYMCMQMFASWFTLFGKWNPPPWSLMLNQKYSSGTWDGIESSSASLSVHRSGRRFVA